MRDKTGKNPLTLLLFVKSQATESWMNHEILTALDQREDIVPSVDFCVSINILPRAFDSRRWKIDIKFFSQNGKGFAGFVYLTALQRFLRKFTRLNS